MKINFTALGTENNLEIFENEMEIIETMLLYQSELDVIINLINKRAKLHNVEISNLTCIRETDKKRLTKIITKNIFNFHRFSNRK